MVVLRALVVGELPDVEPVLAHGEAAHALAAPEGLLHQASPGGVRDEKAIFALIQAIALLRRQPTGLAGLRFTIQANDAAPDVRAPLDADLPPEVTLLPDALVGGTPSPRRAYG